MARVDFDAQPSRAYAALEKAGAEMLLDAIDDAIDALEARARQRGGPAAFLR